MTDFTSSLYLGLDHGSRCLPPWPQLTLGKPAALQAPPGAEPVERDLARLTGCEAAVLAPSTLHLFIDLFIMLAEPGVGIFLDAGSYPITQWAAQQAVAAGVPVSLFESHDPGSLQELLNRAPALRPVVVTDGLTVAAGAAAPLAGYIRLAARKGGLVVVDDTQALGILGTPAGPAAPYGVGGGGSLKHAMLASQHVLLVNSLAKAFGAPVAMLGGSAAHVAHFRAASLTRMHCSPPSAAVIAAAAQAIETNRCWGETLRRRLAERVARFECGLRQLGLRSNRSLFPVRPIRLPEGIDAAGMHAELAARGVRAALLASPAGQAVLTFVITARNSLLEIDKAVDSMDGALQRIARRKKGERYYETPQFRARALSATA